MMFAPKNARSTTIEGREVANGALTQRSNDNQHEEVDGQSPRGGE
jgi:hypothetical protein